MGTNHYFQEHFYSGEQGVVEDLIIEAIQIHGRDVFYIPRESATGLVDPVFGEDILSKFESAYPMEMYIDRTEGFDASGELMSKFGIVTSNQMEWVVSSRRFRQATNNLFDRPREGDLIYFRLKPALFEIKYVNDKVQFYQLGKLYVYNMSTELFKFGQEDIETGIEEIDNIERDVGYRLQFNLGAGTGEFTVGEHIIQGSAIAEVATWDSSTNTLTVIDIDGAFAMGQNIVGQLSGATYLLTSYDDLVDLNDDQNANKHIQTESNTYIDFSEDNPFSDGPP